MKPSVVTSQTCRWIIGVSLVVLLGCTSSGSYAERDIDASASEAVAAVVGAGAMGLELDALRTEWRPLAFQIGQLKFAAESAGERLDLNVALAPALDRLPDELRVVWADSLRGIAADPDGSSGSRLQRELVATAIVVANDPDVAAVFGERVGASIEPDELSLVDLVDVDVVGAQAAIISRISDGEADAERQAG